MFGEVLSLKNYWPISILIAMFGLVSSMLAAAPLADANARSELKQLLLQTEIRDDEMNWLYVRNLDDPRLLLRELAELWHFSRGSELSLLRARTGWMLARFASNGIIGELGLDRAELIDQTIALVQKEKLAVPLDELNYYKADVSLDRAVNRDLNQPNPLLELAAKVQNQNERMLLQAKIASAASDRGDMTDQLGGLLSVIRQQLDSLQGPISGATIQTLSFLHLAFFGIGRRTEAEAIDKILTEHCAQVRLRSLCALRDYEAGMSLIREEKRESAEASKAHFQRALEFSLEIDDKEYIANSYYGLSLAYWKTQIFEEGMRYGKLAYESFVKLNRMVWAASTLKNLASSLLDQNKPEEALKLAQNALAICPQEYSFDIMKIYEKIAQIYQAMGRYKEAYQYSQLYIQKNAEIKAEDADRKYMELRNEALSKQNELQKAQIHLLKKFRIVSILAAGLSIFLCGALVIMWRQGTVIRKSRLRMKQVLDHIDEGIAVLDRKLHIEPGYSAYLGKLFESQGNHLEGSSFLKLLFPQNSVSSDLANMTQGTLLTCIGESSMSWEVNKDHLPYEVSMGDRLLSLHWQPLYSQSKIITRYLVSVRDITELRGIQQQAAYESERAQQLQCVLDEVLRGRVDLIRQIVSEIRKDLPMIQSRIADTGQQEFIMRRLHTWKGGTRTLGLKKLAEVFHELETRVLASPSNASGEKLWTHLLQWLEHYESILASFAGSADKLEARALDLYSYASIYAHEVQQRLSRHGAACGGLWILDRVLAWKPDVLSRIHDMLLHALSNALDHGFLRALRKKNLLGPAVIRILAEPEGEEVVVKLIDNGIGLDWNFLKHKAEKIGFVPAPGQSLTELLFLDGVSSAEAVSETSGRGVGLSAIRSLCRDLAGAIELKDAAGGGTHLQMVFPASAVLLESAQLTATRGLDHSAGF